MSAPDPTRLVRRLADAVESEHDSRRRRLLAALLAHVQAESVDADPVALLDGYGANPRISTWGSSRRDYGAEGPEALAELVEHECATPWATAVEFDIETLVVDFDGIALQGVIRRWFPGTAFAELDSEIDPERDHEWSTMMAVFYRFDGDGRIVSVDTYATGDVTDRIRPLP